MKNATSYKTTPEILALKEQIKAMWQENMTSGQIALALGKTRNQIIGHVTRMDLPTRTGIVRTFTPRPSRPRTDPKPLPSPPPDAPVSLNLSMMELRAHNCQFPYGDSDFTFCGQDRSPGSPYCSYHRARCVVPAHPKRQEAAV